MSQTLSPNTASQSVADAHLALAMEAVEMGAWQWDIRENRVTWSTSLERIHGLEPGSFDGTFEAYQQDIHPEDRERVLRTISHSVEDKQPHFLNYRIVRPDGEVRWLEARGRLVLDQRGEPLRLVGVCMDVTAKRDYEQQWREAQQRQDEAESALRDQTRLAQLSRDISLALTAPGDLVEVLQRCVEAVVTHLGAAFARIWTLNDETQTLELQASAGIYTHLDGAHARVPVGQFKIGIIAEERRPHLTNDVQHDPRVGDHDWARRERMVAFAGYPLLVGDKLVGVLAMFARQALTETDFNGLGTVANALAVGIARVRADVEVRRRIESLAVLALALQRSNRELDQFAYVASHDLKAPLRGIANLSQWIEEDLGDNIQETTREHLRLLRSRAQRMERLIDGVLAYSRAGRSSEAAETVSVGRLLREVIDLASPPESVQFDIADNLPTLKTHRLLLQQVFLNLITNALKYGSADEARVAVTARREGEMWEFAVSDNGPGIDPAFHDKIWEIFQTLQPRDTVEGTGIGLALVKKIVEGRGGRVWVESQVGAGATFRFTWPEAPAGDTN
jgi:PAS domain S-box-containing protein